MQASEGSRPSIQRISSNPPDNVDENSGSFPDVPKFILDKQNSQEDLLRNIDTLSQITSSNPDTGTDSMKSMIRGFEYMNKGGFWEVTGKYAGASLGYTLLGASKVFAFIGAASLGGAVQFMHMGTGILQAPMGLLPEGIFASVIEEGGKYGALAGGYYLSDWAAGILDKCVGEKLDQAEDGTQRNRAERYHEQDQAAAKWAIYFSAAPAYGIGLGVMVATMPIAMFASLVNPSPFLSFDNKGLENQFSKISPWKKENNKARLKDKNETELREGIHLQGAQGMASIQQESRDSVSHADLKEEKEEDEDVKPPIGQIRNSAALNEQRKKEEKEKEKGV